MEGHRVLIPKMEVRALLPEPMKPPLTAVVLAAGAGTRMRSATPKPLMQVGEQPLVAHIINALAALKPDRIVVVVGHGAAAVTEAARQAAPDPAVLAFAHQNEPRGTGDAMAVALKEIPPSPETGPQPVVLVAPADAPLVRSSTLRSLFEAHVSRAAAATLLTANVTDPTGYGRIIRANNRQEHGEVTAIVEHRDATPSQLLINEINSSVYCFNENPLRTALDQVLRQPPSPPQPQTPDQTSSEILLTDVIATLRRNNHSVHAMVAQDAAELMGANTPEQLAACELELQLRASGS